MARPTITDLDHRSIEMADHTQVAPLGVGHLRIDELQATLLAMNGNDAGRELLKALNLDGFVAGTPSIFDSIRKLALSVPGSGVVA